MARIVHGYVLISDQGVTGDPIRPLLYIRVRFPGANRTIIEAHIKQTTDIYECTVFNDDNPIHDSALVVVHRMYPNAVPVRVQLTRVIDVIVEIPSENPASDSDVQRLRVQLPRTRDK
jgi:hypothetical protein